MRLPFTTPCYNSSLFDVGSVCLRSDIWVLTTTGLFTPFFCDDVCHPGNSKAILEAQISSWKLENYPKSSKITFETRKLSWKLKNYPGSSKLSWKLDNPKPPSSWCSGWSYPAYVCLFNKVHATSPLHTPCTSPSTLTLYQPIFTYPVSANLYVPCISQSSRTLYQPIFTYPVSAHLHVPCTSSSARALYQPI